MKMTIPPAPPAVPRHPAASGAGGGGSDSDEASGSGSASTPEHNVYRRKYQLLLERCEVLQQDNERIVNRIHEAKKITRRYKKDIKLLMERLDRHGDNYRTAVAEPEPKAEVSSRPSKPTFSKSERSQPMPKNNSEKQQSGAKKPAKRKTTKGEKTEKDPNAPKKPCNAFFQYCQEQRPLVVAETGGDTGLPELSKQEVTKQLASRWRALSIEDKKVYVAMFERSKEKYAEEIAAYVRKDPTNQ